MGRTTFKERWAARTFWQKVDFIKWTIIGGAWGAILVAVVVALLWETYRVAHLSPAERDVERIAQTRRTAEANARADAERVVAKQAAKRAEDRRVTAALVKELEDAVLNRQRQNVEKCVQERKKLLPGLWPSTEAVGRIEADCADREARTAERGSR